MKIFLYTLFFCSVACNFVGKKNESNDSQISTNTADNKEDDEPRSIEQKATISRSNDSRAIVEGSIKLADLFEDKASLNLTSSGSCSNLSISLTLMPIDGEMESKCSGDALDYKITVEYNQSYALKMEVSNSSTSISGAMIIEPISPGSTGTQSFAFKIPADLEVAAISPDNEASKQIYCCYHQWSGPFGGPQSDHHHASLPNFQDAISDCDLHKFGKIGHTCSCGKTNASETTPANLPTMEPIETYTPPAPLPTMEPIETYTPPAPLPTMVPMETYTPPAPLPTMMATHDHTVTTSLNTGHWCRASANFYRPLNPIGNTLVTETSYFPTEGSPGAWPDVSSSCASRLNEYRNERGT